MSSLLQTILNLAYSEIEQYTMPARALFDVSETKAQSLAQPYTLDTDTVTICHACMDIKLGQCAHEGRITDHVSEGIIFVKSIATEYNISSDLLDKIVDTIACHHGAKLPQYRESEICRNADCYRFLDPQAIMIYFYELSSRGMSVAEAAKQVLYKMDEKRNLLTLDECREELKSSYEYFSGVLKRL